MSHPAPTSSAVAVATFNPALNANVLVLNKFYQAIRVINVRRAFSLLCRELAEVVHIEPDASGASRWLNLAMHEWTELSQLKKEFEPDGFDFVHTVRFSIAVPRIIRLLGYDKLPRQDVKFNRRNIFARDSNRCQYCGKKFSTSDLSLDHVVPRSQGGKATWDNIVCCCIKCNVKKGGRTPEQAHMHLISKPHKPRRSPVINIKLADERYASWKQFLDEAYWTVELK
ncbi:MAG TPA: HNH endonuclease [Tepidisphaeraceae bacterium]|nr:HNH endonuclease [Tepidisphaeraceae bacterium]